MTQLLRNPLIWKLRYILNVYDGKMSISGMIGKAGHLALKTYYGANDDVPVPKDSVEARGIAIDAGLEYLNTFSDQFINYGKTGSREDMLKSYAQAMEFYFAEEPEYHEFLMVEEKIDSVIKTVDGDELPLPASGVPDLVVKNKKGEIEVIDTKFTATFTDYEAEDYVKIIQAEFLFHLLLAKGIKAERCIFREIKRTKNKDGSPQIRDWVVPADHEPYRIIFYNLYRDVVKFLSNDPVFLPNFSDMLDGEHAGLIYAQGLINADMSDVEVMHKVKDVAFTTKKFVASRLDRAENQSLPAEEKIAMKLREFGIPVEPVEVIEGASVWQYRFNVSAGVRMETIKKRKDDIAQAIAAKGEVRILAPIPGTNLVGVEIAKDDRKSVLLTEKDFRPGTLMLHLGVSVDGTVVRVALEEMPHLLIAGATGSGKSVLLHNIIRALIKQKNTKELELILMDSKRVELTAFAKDKHVRGKIIFEYDDAVNELLWLVDVMEKRFENLEKNECRDILEFNVRNEKKYHMDYKVLIIDEYADLILRSRADEKKNKANVSVEMLIVRLAQMGRAVGIHLIISTQRPSVDVISGLIKANFPTRVALTTSSPTDSIVILGQPGAEKLTGKGDSLLISPGLPGLMRVQGFALK